MITKWKTIYNEYPKQFWVLLLGTFIDRVGGFMVFPFFPLYVTDHFGVGMREIGILFAIFTFTGIVGGILGGALTDKFGRKSMMLYGLVVSGVSSVAIIFIDDLIVFYIVGGFMGFLGSLGGPAQQAMVADILPEEQRSEGFGLFRIAFNLSAAIGPILGGIFAASAFHLLFIGDAITSVITAVIVYIVIKESRPEKAEDEPEQTIKQSIGGYGKVFRDTPYMLFLAVSVLQVAVYMQMNITLPVFMRDSHGFEPIYYGYILSMNALIVVLFQFWVTRKVSKSPPMLVMAFGTVFYMIGFAMYGFISAFIMFAIAMIIITIGEMVVSPVAQTLVAKFAPEDMRGRYMAIFGFSWAIPNMFAPYIAGYIMDVYDPNWVWYLSGIMAAITTLGYFWLHRIRGDEAVPTPPLQATETV